jgi:PAS domain S-box-containing protein
MDEQSEAGLYPALNYQAIFEQIPAPYLVLDTNFHILAQNDAHLAVTNTQRSKTIGRSLFAVFPDNPDDSNAEGLSHLRRSLLTVIKTRQPHVLPTLKYDIKRKPGEGGGYETRYWRVVNTPVLGPDGYVLFIINQAEDITELTELRRRLGITETAE